MLHRGALARRVAGPVVRGRHGALAGWSLPSSPRTATPTSNHVRLEGLPAKHAHPQLAGLLLEGERRRGPGAVCRRACPRPPCRRRPAARAWGVEVRTWAWAYPAYLFVAAAPGPSIIRYLLLAFPLLWPWPEVESFRTATRVQRGAVVFLAAAGWCCSGSGSPSSWSSPPRRTTARFPERQRVSTIRGGGGGGGGGKKKKRMATGVWWSPVHPVISSSSPPCR